MAAVPDCIVCQEPYDENLRVPRLLTCGHTLCELCLKKIELPYPAASRAALSGTVIRCPECNQRTRRPAGGQALPKNIVLLRLLPDLIRPRDEPTDSIATSQETSQRRHSHEVDVLVDSNLQRWSFIDPPSVSETTLPFNSRTRQSEELGDELRAGNALPVPSNSRTRQVEELGDELPAGNALPVPSNSRTRRFEELGDALASGNALPSGKSLVSTSKKYTFTNEEDGNLCVYNEGDPKWSPGTRGKGSGDLMLLTDGNLVLFDTGGTGKPVWATMSQGIGKAPGPYKLIMQDDGNLVIYGYEHVPTWARWSDTSSGLFTNVAGTAEMPSVVTFLQTCDTLVSRNGMYTFVNQGDGDLCVYNQHAKATWSSGTRNKGAGNLYLQGDGNLVLYNTIGDGASPGAPIWSSGTARRGISPHKLIMQDNGNLMLYDANSKPVWTSNAGAVWRSFVRSELPANSTLCAGDSLVSEAEEYTFVNQVDGNLVTYTKHGRATWASGTGPGRLTRGVLQLLSDGNLVLFDANGTFKPVWASMSQGIARSAGPYRLVMQDDGNLVIYGISGATWATRTLDSTSGPFTDSAGNVEMRSNIVTWLQPCDTLVSRNRKYLFVNQADGNLVIYNRKGSATWASGTYRKGTGNLYLQTNGNLVLYNTDGEVGDPGAPMWSSGTSRMCIGPYRLFLQDDGNLVIYDNTHRPSWASKPMARPESSTSCSDTLYSSDVLRTNETLVSTNGVYKFVNQADGNLVIYSGDGLVRWALGTNNRGAGTLCMERDGQLVLYNTSGGFANPRAPIWSSESRWGPGPFKLVMQDDGNLVIYDSNHHPTWETNSS